MSEEVKTCVASAIKLYILLEKLTDSEAVKKLGESDFSEIIRLEVVRLFNKLIECGIDMSKDLEVGFKSLITELGNPRVHYMHISTLARDLIERIKEFIKF